MAKYRVYEYAKKLNMSSKEIITILKRLDLPVNNHMSVVDEEAQAKIDQFFQDIRRRAQEARMKKELEQQKLAQSAQLKARAEKGETVSGTKTVEEQKSQSTTNSVESVQVGGEAQGSLGATPVPELQVEKHTEKHTQKRTEKHTEKHTEKQTVSAGRSFTEQRERPAQRREAQHTDRRGAKPRSGEDSRGGRDRTRDLASRGEARGASSRPSHTPSADGKRDQARDVDRDGGRKERFKPAGQRDRDGGRRGDGTYRGEGARPGAPSGVKRDRRGLAIPPAPVAEEKNEPTRRRTQKKTPKEFESRKDEIKKPGKKLALKEKLPLRAELDLDEDLGNDDFGTVTRGKRRNKNRKHKDVTYAEDKVTPTKIAIDETIQVSEFAQMIGKEPAEVIKKLFMLGIMATINQDIDFDAATLVAGEYGIEVEKKIVLDEVEFETIEEQDDPHDLIPRPPVVTIMGHVDHGKTTLLDAIRKTRVVQTEAGGITQHIGAYQVEVGDKKITFLDTPGHEAFTSMRARGAKVTDITVLVVAADDGVMPQTVEAMNHARAADVPIIVAVNKIDKPSANPDRVMQELSEHGLIPEAWGGDTIFVSVSALKGQGIDELLEMILLVTELKDLKANPNKRARGTVIEAKLDRGRGPVATVLVQNGTLKIGDSLVIGTTYGRVRSMHNHLGERVQEAPPSTPVEITGLENVPQAGDQFMVFEDDGKARSIAEERALKRREQELRKKNVSLDELFSQIREGDTKELSLIIKGDVQGSVEALRASIEKIKVEGVRVGIIHTGVGAINESDVMLAKASNAIIIGFNVRPDANARVSAEREKIDIRLYSVIYKAIEELEAALKGMLDPVYEEKIIGQAEVRQTFHASKIGTIAGCYVTDGVIRRDAGVRIIRDGVVIYEGKIDSLKRFKDDAKEVAQGYECGITVLGYNDIREGDTLEAFIMQTVDQV
ncbi:MAG: translation initiation factor IF-2 [Candidatus Carbobacillus altaicus]|nr:translation initiation factor IF-2 [Candidatus Carbobacillus altaicus]